MTSVLFRSGLLLATLSLTPAVAVAFPSSSEPKVPTLTDARRAIETGRFNEATSLLSQYLRDEPKSPDGWNLLGYAERKAGRLDASRSAYDKALALDPDHRQAREYLGELLLMRKDVAGAEAQLRELDRLCPQGCPERSTLGEAIAAVKAGRDAPEKSGW